MNEHELKQSMRDTMAVTTMPPPMSETPVLEAGRRAKRRRRAQWAGAGSVAAVVAIAVGVVIVAPGGGGGPTVQLGDAQTTETAPGEKTETSWPNGQTDRTATSGPRYDKGVTLHDGLRAALPDGVEAPDGLTYEDKDYGGGPLNRHQSQYDDTIGGTEVWRYDAYVPVTKGTGLGEVSVEVITAGNPAVGDGCALAASVWQTGGTCEDVRAGGGTVGVVTVGADAENWNYEQSAIFRHQDGTVVIVAQARTYAGSGQPAMPELPLTRDQLAGLAVEAGFKLD